MLANDALLKYAAPFYPSWGVYAGKNKAFYAGAIFFSTDGTKLYSTGDGVGLYKVLQYTLSTAWDITTATLDKIAEGYPAYSNAIFLSPDGEHVFISNSYSVNTIFQYTLSTAWDISTAEAGDRFDLSYSPSYLYFSPNGLRMYCRQDKYNIVQYALSSAWDVSTASVVRSIYIFDFTEDWTEIDGIFFSPDGKKFYFNDRSTRRILQWKVSTPWDISTIIKNSKSIRLYTSDCYGLYIDPSGVNMYVFDTRYKIMYQYEIPVWPR